MNSRTNLTVSIDSEIKKRAMELMRKHEPHGFASSYIEQALKKYIDKKEVNYNGFLKEKKEKRIHKS